MHIFSDFVFHGVDGMDLRLLQNMLSLYDGVFQRDSLYRKVATIGKLYPLSFAVSVVTILFMVAFSGAPAREMMKIAYQDIFPAWLMTFMMGVVDIGIGMLAWYAPLDFVKIMLSHHAQYFGTEHVKNIAILKVKFEALIQDFKRIKPEHAQVLKESVLSRVGDLENVETELEGAKSYRENCGAHFYHLCFSRRSDLEEGAAKKLLPKK